MSVLEPLQTAIKQLEEDKTVKLRKLAAESFELALSNEDIVRELDTNGLGEKKSKRFTWTKVFNSVVNCFNKEAKSIKDKSKANDNQKCVFTLVQRVVSVANRHPDRPYLGIDVLLPFTLELIHKDVMLSTFGPQIIDLIHQFLIPVFFSRMVGEKWTDLIKGILLMLERQNSAPKSSILEALNTAILHGSDYADVIPLLRKRVLAFFEKSLSNKDELRMHGMLYLDGFLKLCQRNALEFRGLLCRVGEIVFPDVLYTLSTPEGHEKACELFLVQMKLHMPCDVEPGSPAFYCDNVPKWLSTVKSLHEFCLDTIGEIAQKRKQRNQPKSVKISKHLLMLSVKCTAQVSKFSSTYELLCNDSNQPPLAKKSKSCKTFQQIIQDTCSINNEAEQSIWLFYIKAVLDQFPALIESESDFATLMRTATSLLTSTTAVATDIFSFLRCLISCEEHLLKINILKEKSALWNYIWDLVIRSLSVNETDVEALHLLEEILVQFKPTNVHSLLSLYLNDSLPLEKYSLNLLREYLLNCTLPSSKPAFNSSKRLVTQMNENSWCPRLLLLRWLMPENVLGIHPDCDDLIYVLQCALLIKRTNLLLISEGLKYQRSRHDASSDDDFETALLTCSFDAPPVSLKTAVAAEASTAPSITDSKISHMVRIFVDSDATVAPYLDYLQRDYKRLLSLESNNTHLIKRLRELLFRVKSYLSLLNFMEKYKIEASDTFNFKTTVEELFNLSLASYVSKLNIFLSQQMDDNSLTVICGIRSLIQSQSLCDGTKNLLVSNFPQDITENLLKYLVQKGLQTNTENKSDFVVQTEDEGNVDRERKRNLACLEIVRCLSDFGLISSCDYRVDLFGRIIKYFSVAAAIRHINHFDLCAELVVCLIPMMPATSSLSNSIFNLMKLMSEAQYKNKKCAIQLWSIITKLIPVIRRMPSGNDAADSAPPPKVRLMGCIKSSMSVFQSSQDIILWRMILAAMSQLAKNDPHLSWSFCISKNDGASKHWPLFELYKHLNIRSHQVRLYMIETLQCIFQNVTPPLLQNSHNSSQEAIPNYALVQSCFNNVYQAIVDSFHVPCDFSPAEKKEEEVNCISIALLCLSHIIFSTGYIQQQALAHFVLLVKIKAIRIDLSHSALQRAHPKASEIVMYNAPSLLEKWVEEQQRIKEFPFQLLDFSDYNTFLKQFRDHIVVRLFELNKMEELDEVAKDCRMTIQALIKQNFCKIFARHAALQLSKRTSNVERLSSSLYEVHSKLVQAVGGPEVFYQLVSTSYGDIILEECSILFNHRIPEKWGYPEFSIPQPKPVFFTEEGILNSLSSLREMINASGHSIIDNLAISSPQTIHRLLIVLARRVHEAYDVIQRFQTLHHFSYFVDILLNNRESTFALTKDYVSHFVIHAYLRFLSFTDPTDQDDHFLRAVVVVLNEFIGKLVAIVPKEIEHYYRHLIYKLTTKVSTHPHLADSLKIPLDCLLVINKNKFSTLIASLDPFPDDVAMFQDYRRFHKEERYKVLKDSPSLCTELKCCLVEIKKSNNICTKERLQYIRKILIEGQEEFASIVKGLEKKRFHDECTDDVVHQVMQLLVEITNKTEDEDVRNEAARCLGEVGPIDLSVLVLPPHQNETKLFATATTIVSSMLDMVINYVAADDITVTAAASNVLANLLTHKEYHDFVKNPDCDHRLQSLLRPFQSSLTRETDEKINAVVLKTKLDEMDQNTSYSSWINNFTLGLISCFHPERSMISKLEPLCALKAEFCEDVLPFVVKSVLYHGRSNPLVRKEMTAYIRDFFSQFVNCTANDATGRNVTPPLNRESSIYKNKLALRCLLRIVQYLRIHNIPEEFARNKCATPWDNNFWLELDYMDVAKAAQYCGAFLSSILYVEIFALENELTPEDLLVSSEEEGSSYYTQDSSDGGTRAKFFNIHKILLKAYTSIGEEDGVYGCGSARFSDFQSSIQHLEQLQRWGQILSAVDAHGVQNETRICNSLKNLGLYNSLWTHLRGIEARDGSINDELLDVEYECGWRLSNWDINSEKVNYLKDSFHIDPKEASGPFQKFVYESIQTGLKGDRSGYDQNIRRGFHVVVEGLRHASLESSENLYNFLSQFQMLRVIEDIFESDEKHTEAISKKWENHSMFTVADFKYQEPVLYMKKTLLSARNTKYPNLDLAEACNDILFDLLVKARNSGRLELSEKYASEINVSESNGNFVRKQLEIARNHWVRGSEDIAKHMLDKLIQKQSSEGGSFYPSLLLQYGQWLYETVAESPTVVFHKYLIQSCELLEKKQDASSQEIAEAHMVVAKYADSQYQKLVDYMQSDLYREKKVLYNKSREEQAKTQQTTQDIDTKKSLHFMRKQALIDNEEMQNTIKEKTWFKNEALCHYMRALNSSTEYDLFIFRCIALWLENSPHGEGDAQSSKIIAEEPMPAYKFIGVLHQLSARLGSSNVATTDLLTKIIMKCAEVHPFHTLPVILTQAMMYKDKEIVGKSASKKSIVSGQERITAAVNILEKLQKGRSTSQCAMKMAKLWDALIAFANTREAPQKGGDQKKFIPATALISTLKSLENIPVPILPLAVSPSGKYNNIIGIKSFGKHYQLVGGINAPKKLTCIGTNGNQYNMLLKGNDDLRQDAVMQQVFSAMNAMLSTEPKTKKRRLLVRTYKVVPLSQRSGVIEWCENTQTFGDYLTGGGTNIGAHILYRPSDYKPIDCRRTMGEVKDCGDAEKKHQTYLKIMENFKPVFRHFFFENFKDAGSFFERRLAYTRSVATSSMVGYILGVGDRHVLNILVDRTTAEFIHIDLGVAFDQGQVLPTPETIPFRLTRDVLDGMGVCGIDGVFRRSCEMTLEVLRKHSDIILTILEVLLYDPLYLWTLTEDRKQKIQPVDSRTQSRNSSIFGELETEQRNNSAARELRRLRCKLAGIHEGGLFGTSMNVPGQVAFLIQEAIDPTRLCRLFPGWQPYL